MTWSRSPKKRDTLFLQMIFGFTKTAHLKGRLACVDGIPIDMNQKSYDAALQLIRLMWIVRFLSPSLMVPLVPVAVLKLNVNPMRTDCDEIVV